MKRALLLALLLCCSKAPPAPPSGHGGANATAGGTVTGSGGSTPDSGLPDAPGTGGKPPSDASLLDLVEQADVGAQPDCGIPNGGIGPCLDPAKDCPPETACWSWKCEFGHCTAVPKS